MATIIAMTDNDRITLYGTGTRYVKDRIKAVGGRWDWSKECWSVPAAAAEQLIRDIEAEAIRVLRPQQWTWAELVEAGGQSERDWDLYIAANREMKRRLGLADSDAPSFSGGGQEVRLPGIARFPLRGDHRVAIPYRKTARPEAQEAFLRQWMSEGGEVEEQ